MRLSLAASRLGSLISARCEALGAISVFRVEFGRALAVCVAVGEVLADLATGREPDLPAERFAVRRSALGGA